MDLVLQTTENTPTRNTRAETLSSLENGLTQLKNEQQNTGEDVPRSQDKRHCKEQLNRGGTATVPLMAMPCTTWNRRPVLNLEKNRSAE